VILGAMLSRLVCKDSENATSPRKHVAASQYWAPVLTWLLHHAFAVIFQKPIFLQTIRESMAPNASNASTD
jgi:hypothetical protein